MKKKLLECPLHGLTLHRCKRKAWHTKPTEFSTEYTEKCFKCIQEGRYKKRLVVKQKKKQFISLKGESP